MEVCIKENGVLSYIFELEEYPPTFKLIITPPAKTASDRGWHFEISNYEESEEIKQITYTTWNYYKSLSKFNKKILKHIDKLYRVFLEHINNIRRKEYAVIEDKEYDTQLEMYVVRNALEVTLFMYSNYEYSDPYLYVSLDVEKITQIIDGLTKARQDIFNSLNKEVR